MGPTRSQQEDRTRPPCSCGAGPWDGARVGSLRRSILHPGSGEGIMNPTKPAAWRSFCPQFNRGLTFQLVLNLGKGHFQGATQCGTTTRAGQSALRRLRTLPQINGHHWEVLQTHPKVAWPAPTKAGVPGNREASRFSALGVPARAPRLRSSAAEPPSAMTAPWNLEALMPTPDPLAGQIIGCCYRVANGLGYRTMPELPASYRLDHLPVGQFRQGQD